MEKSKDSIFVFLYFCIFVHINPKFVSVSVQHTQMKGVWLKDITKSSEYAYMPISENGSLAIGPTE